MIEGTLIVWTLFFRTPSGEETTISDLPTVAECHRLANELGFHSPKMDDGMNRYRCIPYTKSMPVHQREMY